MGGQPYNHDNAKWDSQALGKVLKKDLRPKKTLYSQLPRLATIAKPMVPRLPSLKHSQKEVGGLPRSLGAEPGLSGTKRKQRTKRLSRFQGPG